MTTKLHLNTLLWNMATGLYYFLLVYFLNKYGLQLWFQISNRVGIFTRWKDIATKALKRFEKKCLIEMKLVEVEVSPSAEAPGPASDVHNKELHERLDNLSKQGWRRGSRPTLSAKAIGYGEANEPLEVQRHSNVDPPLECPTSEPDTEGRDPIDRKDEGYVSTTKRQRLLCSLVLTFQCVLSGTQVRGWAARMQELFGSTPRVESFERSTVLQSQSWIYEGLLHDFAALLQEAAEETDQCTLQVDGWGVLLRYTGQEVELVKLQGTNVPSIRSANQVAADELEITGLHLDGAELDAQTRVQSAQLLSKLCASGAQGTEIEGLEVFAVKCPPKVLYHGAKIYACTTVTIDGSSICVQSASVPILPIDVNSITAEILPWILPLLVVQMSLSASNPSRLGGPMAAIAGQVSGWLLGWLTMRFFAPRFAGNQKAPQPMDIKDQTVSAWMGFAVFFLLQILSWTHSAVFYWKLMLVVAMLTYKVGVAIRRRPKPPITKVEDSVSRHWLNVMNIAITYDEWAHAATMLNIETGANEWKIYDEEFVRGKLEELHLRRSEGSFEDILFSLRADISRKLGYMCNPQLHVDRPQLPLVIQDYLNEVRQHLQAVCDIDPEECTLEEKLLCLTETRQRFGRTTLVFSGHIPLGTFHSTVLRTLVEHQLLPSVVVGANVGAIVASFATTSTASELRPLSHDRAPPMHFNEKLSTVYVAAYRLSTQEASSYDLKSCNKSTQDLLGDLTFEEAFALSGRILEISIPSCPVRKKPAQFLNYLVSPHVVIWSAAAVSYAPPVGLFHHCELLMKDRYGSIVPYVAPTKMTLHAPGCDATLEIEIPMQQLRELFNVNNFVISQTSPYIAPWLHFKETPSIFRSKLVKLFEMEVKHRCAQLLDMGFKLWGFASLYSREWEGDIIFVLPITFGQAIFRAQTEDPAPDELRKTAMAGRRCTWANYQQSKQAVG